jgi:hypothetical protein
MNRVLLVIAFALFLTGSIFARGANGLGLYGNLVGSGTGAFTGGLGLTYMHGDFPVLGLEYMLLDKASSLGVSCDWWIVNGGLAGSLGYYIGVGGFLGMRSGDNSSAFSLGGRIPFGLQAWVLNPLEIFLEIAPLVGFLPSLNINFNLRLGFRVHF